MCIFTFYNYLANIGVFTIIQAKCMIAISNTYILKHDKTRPIYDHPNPTNLPVRGFLVNLIYI